MKLFAYSVLVLKRKHWYSLFPTRHLMTGAMMARTGEEVSLKADRAARSTYGAPGTCIVQTTYIPPGIYRGAR